MKSPGVEAPRSPDGSQWFRFETPVDSEEAEGKTHAIQAPAHPIRIVRPDPEAITVGVVIAGQMRDFEPAAEALRVALAPFPHQCVVATWRDRGAKVSGQLGPAQLRRLFPQHWEPIVLAVDGFMSPADAKVDFPELHSVLAEHAARRGTVEAADIAAVYLGAAIEIREDDDFVPAIRVTDAHFANTERMLDRTLAGLRLLREVGGERTCDVVVRIRPDLVVEPEALRQAIVSAVLSPGTVTVDNLHAAGGLGDMLTVADTATMESLARALETIEAFADRSVHQLLRSLWSMPGVRFRQLSSPPSLALPRYGVELVTEALAAAAATGTPRGAQAATRKRFLDSQVALRLGETERAAAILDAPQGEDAAAPLLLLGRILLASQLGPLPEVELHAAFVTPWSRAQRDAISKALTPRLTTARHCDALIQLAAKSAAGRVLSKQSRGWTSHCQMAALRAGWVDLAFNLALQDLCCGFSPSPSIALVGKVAAQLPEPARRALLSALRDMLVAEQRDAVFTKLMAIVETHGTSDPKLVKESESTAMAVRQPLGLFHWNKAVFVLPRTAPTRALSPRVSAAIRRNNGAKAKRKQLAKCLEGQGSVLQGYLLRGEVPGHRKTQEQDEGARAVRRTLLAAAVARYDQVIAAMRQQASPLDLETRAPQKSGVPGKNLAAALGTASEPSIAGAARKSAAGARAVAPPGDALAGLDGAAGGKNDSLPALTRASAARRLVPHDLGRQPSADPPADLQGTVIIDLDGTLTDDAPGVPYPEKPPRPEIIARLHEWRACGMGIVVFTARNMRTFGGNEGRIIKETVPIILEWLHRHDVPFDELRIGKPWCGPNGFLVDDRAIRPDEFARLSKQEIFALLGIAGHHP